MNKILGLDISTSIIGICVLTNKKRISSLDYIDLRKIKGFWNKIEYSKIRLKEIFKKHKITNIIIEEPLKRKSKQSSINTIILLQRFNAIISYICKEETGIEPNILSAIKLRSSCGIKLESKKKAGKTHKEQTFDFMIKTKLKNKIFPKTRNGNYQAYCYDMVDAYVCALGFIESQL